MESPDRPFPLIGRSRRATSSSEKVVERLPPLTEDAMEDADVEDLSYDNFGRRSVHPPTAGSKNSPSGRTALSLALDKFFCCLCLRYRALDPRTPIMSYWDLVMTAFILYTAVITPCACRSRS